MVAVLTAALAGCGGSSRPARAVRALPRSRLPSPRRRARPGLPGSSRRPMVCTVYESGYATQVIFASETFDVRAECRAWTRNRAGEGYLWGYQPARASIQPTESRQVCFVADRAGIVAARVIEVTGLRAGVGGAGRARVVGMHEPARGGLGQAARPEPPASSAVRDERTAAPRRGGRARCRRRASSRCARRPACVMPVLTLTWLNATSASAGSPSSAAVSAAIAPPELTTSAVCPFPSRRRNLLERRRQAPEEAGPGFPARTAGAGADPSAAARR